MATKSEVKISLSSTELRQIMAEYAYEDSIFNDEDDKATKVKKALSKINEADKIIYCLYLEYGSSRKVGKILGCSRTTVLKLVTKIRQDIISNL